MRDVRLSEVAERAVNALSDRHLIEFRTIQSYLAGFLPALEAANLVVPSRFFGVEGYRYWDRTFPFLVYFRIAIDEEGARSGTDLPGRTRIQRAVQLCVPPRPRRLGAENRPTTRASPKSPTPGSRRSPAPSSPSPSRATPLR